MHPKFRRAAELTVQHISDYAWALWKACKVCKTIKRMLRFMDELSNLKMEDMLGLNTQSVRHIT
jgi:hypothetical protein